jgi:hypothetical protein
MSDMGYLIAVISAIGAIGAALVTYYLYLITKRNLVYQVIVNLQMEYRKPEMQYALWSLWDLYDKCNKDEERLISEYEKKYREEKELLGKYDRLEEEPGKNPVEIIKRTLDHQRRLVSQYYHHLAVLTVNNIVPKNIIYKIWGEDDLRIIPEILIPMHKKLREIHQMEPADEYSDMYQLYIDSKDYE